MPKLFRRSWERFQQGRAGAISSVLPARTGADGAVAGAAFATPVAVFTSASASFVGGDVGRKIRLTGTTGSGRYDGVYVIDAVTNGTTVNLRHNHNVGGTPNSPARFFENSASVVWRILEACTFTADAAGDIEDFYPGSYILVEGATNAANNGLWLISHRTSSQVVMLCKGYIFWRTDYNAPGLGTFTSDALNTDFVNETGLRWSITDREPHNSADLWEMMVQALMDCGWTMYHQRGHNSTMLTVGDVVLRSLGETDAAIPGGKLMFLRCVMSGFGRNGAAAYNTGMIFGWSLYPHWDVTLTAVGTASPGDGAANLKGTVGSTSHASNTAGTNQGTSTDCWPALENTQFDYANMGRNGLPHDTKRRDFVFFGDRDEVYLFTNQSSSINVTSHFQVGHIKVIGSNPNIVTVTAPVAAGSNKDLNVGTVDMQALTPPYAVGDNITIIGRKSSATKEYIETTTIVSFNNADTNNRLVRVTTLVQPYGNGPDTLKAQIGEDPFPVVIESTTNTSYTPRIHNLARIANATGRDYDDTNKGSVAVDVSAITTFAEVNPDRKTGKYGIVPVHIKSTANGEYRGRWRYFYRVSANELTLGKKLISGADVYVIVHSYGTTDATCIGPMSKAMAGIR